MLMNTLIHALELITALLVMLLTIQITRCYRAEQSQRSVLQRTQSHTDDTLHAAVSQREADIPQLNEIVQVDVAEMPATPAPKAVRTSASEAILNDYIGGFFEAPAAADIGAYKAAESPLAVKQQPVEAEAAVPALEELEEDIIVVAEGQDQVYVKDKVMYDKVVHAMLDEAKMVCAS